MCGPARGYFTVIVALIIAAGTGVLIGAASRIGESGEAENRTAHDLAKAKAALIAYAVTQTAVPNPLLPAILPTRPGELPCPDFDGDGFEDDACAGGAPGWLPWRTLGIEPLRDTGGELLWYAVSGPFRRSPLGSPQINSDTTGDLRVRAPTGAVLTNTAAAVIIAPGPAVGAQTRNVLPTAAENYLEAYRDGLNTVLGNNALVAGPFVVAPPTSAFNDQVAALLTSEIIPPVEMRVAGEIRQVLDRYQRSSDFGTLPWAVAFDSVGSTSEVGVNRGRLPLVALPDDWGSPTASGTPLPTLPAWFIPNGWRDFLYYTFSGFVMMSQGGCATCTSDFLTLDGKRGYLALIFTPGTSRVGARTYTRLADFLESNDAADDQYIVPPFQRLDQDHVRYIEPIPRSQCGPTGAEFASIAPCGQPSRINGACLRLATQLQACGCAAAAVQLVNPPCQNTLNPATCQAARDSVLRCG